MFVLYPNIKFFVCRSNVFNTSNTTSTIDAINTANINLIEKLMRINKNYFLTVILPIVMQSATSYITTCAIGLTGCLITCIYIGSIFMILWCAKTSYICAIRCLCDRSRICFDC